MTDVERERSFQQPDLITEKLKSAVGDFAKSSKNRWRYIPYNSVCKDSMVYPFKGGRNNLYLNKKVAVAISGWHDLKTDMPCFRFKFFLRGSDNRFHTEGVKFVSSKKLMELSTHTNWLYTGLGNDSLLYQIPGINRKMSREAKLHAIRHYFRGIDSMMEFDDKVRSLVDEFNLSSEEKKNLETMISKQGLGRKYKLVKVDE